MTDLSIHHRGEELRLSHTLLSADTRVRHPLLSLWPHSSPIVCTWHSWWAGDCLLAMICLFHSLPTCPLMLWGNQKKTGWKCKWPNSDHQVVCWHPVKIQVLLILLGTKEKIYKGKSKLTLYPSFHRKSLSLPVVSEYNKCWCHYKDSLCSNSFRNHSHSNRT